MKFFINFENGSSMKYSDIESFINELRSEINDCMDNGGTSFSVDITADAPCFLTEQNYVQMILDKYQETLQNYSPEHLDVICENGYYYIMYHSRHDSFPVSENIVKKELVDKNILIEQLNQKHISYQI